VSDRNAASRWHCNGTGHPGDDPHWHSGGDAGLHFFPSATEDEWIAAFEAHHGFAVSGARDQQFLDGALWDRMVIRRLGDVDQLRARGDLRQTLSRGKPVVENHISLP
jgi:hypothetical protein